VEFPVFWRLSIANFDGSDEWRTASDIDMRCDDFDIHIYTDAVDRLLRLQIAARLENKDLLERACTLTLALLNENCDHEMSPVEVNRLFYSSVRHYMETGPEVLGPMRRLRAGIYAFLATLKHKHLVSADETLALLKTDPSVRTVAHQSIYMHIASAFSLEPETCMRNIMALNSDDGVVKDELNVVGAMVGQMALCKTSTQLAGRCAMLDQSTLMQPGCHKRVRSFLCMLIRSIVDEKCIYDPFAGSCERISKSVLRCIRTFTGFDIGAKKRDEVLTLATLLMYEQRPDVFRRVDLLVADVWPLLSQSQRLLVQASMLGFVIKDRSTKKRHLFEGSPTRFYWQQCISSSDGFERFLEDVLSKMNEMDDELLCVCAITTECVRQAGKGVPGHGLDAIFHASAARYVVSSATAAPGDVIVSVPFARLRIYTAASEILKRPELLLNIDLETLPVNATTKPIIEDAKGKRNSAVDEVEKKTKTKKERRRERRLLQRSVSIQVDRAKRDCEEFDANEPEKLAVEEEPLVEHTQVEEDVTQVECSQTILPDETTIKGSDWSLAGRRREQKVHRAFRWCAFQEECSHENCLFYHENRECDVLVPPPLCNRGIQCHGYRCHFMHLSRENYVRVCQMSKDDAIEYSESIELARAVRETTKEAMGPPPIEYEAIQLAMEMSLAATQPALCEEEDAILMACEISMAESRSDATFDESWQALQCELAQEEDTHGLEPNTVGEECVVCFGLLESRRTLFPCCGVARTCMCVVNWGGMACPFCRKSCATPVSIVV